MEQNQRTPGTETVPTSAAGMGAAPLEPAPLEPTPREPTPLEPAPVTPRPVAVTATPTARKGGGARLINIALARAVALAIAGVAFAAGRFTAPSPVTAGNFPNRGGGQGFPFSSGAPNGRQGGAGGFLAGGGVTVQGTVESITATTLTLKTASGQTIQIALGGTTTYHAQSDASASDVTTGGTVLVRLNLRGGAGNGGTGGNGGAAGNGDATNPTASDVTVVP